MDPYDLIRNPLGVISGGNGGNSPSGGGAGAYYKCASVDTANSKWSGYKLVKREDGIHEIDTAISSGLSYTLSPPTVGKIYSEDAVVEVAYIPVDTGIPEDNLLVYLVGDSYTDASGNDLGVEAFGSNRMNLTQYKGFDCFYTSRSDTRISVNTDITGYGFYPGNSRSYSMRICVPFAPSTNVTYQLLDTYIYNGGEDKTYDYLYLTYNQAENKWYLHFEGYGVSNSVQIAVTYDVWLHVGVSIDTNANVTKLFFNGICVAENNNPYNNWTYNVYGAWVLFGGAQGKAEQGFRNGYFCKLRMYKDVLTADEMRGLAKEV